MLWHFWTFFLNLLLNLSCFFAPLLWSICNDSRFPVCRDPKAKKNSLPRQGVHWRYLLFLRNILMVVIISWSINKNWNFVFHESFFSVNLPAAKSSKIDWYRNLNSVLFQNQLPTCSSRHTFKSRQFYFKLISVVFVPHSFEFQISVRDCEHKD